MTTSKVVIINLLHFCSDCYCRNYQIFKVLYKWQPRKFAPDSDELVNSAVLWEGGRLATGHLHGLTNGRNTSVVSLNEMLWAGAAVRGRRDIDDNTEDSRHRDFVTVDCPPQCEAVNNRMWSTSTTPPPLPPLPDCQQIQSGQKFPCRPWLVTSLLFVASQS